jgi:thiol-disulfide isomerase/thioredoxin
MKKLVLIAGLILLAVIIFKKPAPATIGPMPQFKLVKINGGDLKSEELKGKVLIVDFWASWCEPCKSEIPKFNKLAASLAGKDFAMIGYAVDSGDSEDVQKAAKELGIQYQVVMGTDDVTAAFGNYRGLPTTFIVGKDGNIYKKYEGAPVGVVDQITKDVAELLNVSYTASTAQLAP